MAAMLGVFDTSSGGANPAGCPIGFLAHRLIIRGLTVYRITTIALVGTIAAVVSLRPRRSTVA
jgi:hypothetical protein